MLHRGMRRRWIVAALAVATVVVLALAVVSSLGFARLDSFERVGDGERLIVQAIHDQGETVVWSAAREQRDDVTVFVLMYRPPGLRPLLAFRASVEVELSTPLGARAVVDGTGQRVPETP